MDTIDVRLPWSGLCKVLLLTPVLVGCPLGSPPGARYYTNGTDADGNVWVALFNDEFGCLWRQLVIFDPHCNTEAHKHGALADMVEDILDKSPGVQPLPLEQYERRTSWQHWEATLFTSKDVRA